MDDRSIQPDDRMPDGLKADLEVLYRRTVPVPPGVDEAILVLARRRRVAWPWAMAGSAAAIAAAVGLAVWLHSPGASERFARTPLALAEYTRTGDIRDAFFLARQLKAGVRPGLRWDTNGDGVVDQRDVDALAMDAVRLSRGDSGFGKGGAL